MRSLKILKQKKAKEHHIDSDYDSDDLQLPTLENEKKSQIMKWFGERKKEEK